MIEIAEREIERETTAIPLEYAYSLQYAQRQCRDHFNRKYLIAYNMHILMFIACNIIGIIVHCTLIVLLPITRVTNFTRKFETLRFLYFDRLCEKDTFEKIEKIKIS